jgi:TFIIF-interacting CTD phosphatase-like protein
MIAENIGKESEDISSLEFNMYADDVKVNQEYITLEDDNNDFGGTISPGKTTKIISNIKQALKLNDDDNIQASNLETSKLSNDSTLTDSSSSSKDSINMNHYLNSFDYFQFEHNFKKYYVDSSQNNNGNYDNYVKNALKLISLIPFRKLNLNEKIKEISKKINYENLKKNETDKKLLILDLDETLIHSDLDFSFKNKKIYDTVLYFDSEEEKNIPLPLIVRPGLYEFLDYASQNFDLAVFTASDQEYADAIINYIEKDKNILN